MNTRKSHTHARCVHCHARLTPRESADAFTCESCKQDTPTDRAAYLLLLAAVCLALALLVGRLFQV
jgi:ribosomal protein L37AE/L43A